MVEGRTWSSSEQYSPNLKMRLGPEIVQVRIVAQGVDWIGRKKYSISIRYELTGWKSFTGLLSIRWSESKW